MKCPYRTTTTIEELNTTAQIGRVERVEFADCIKEECPFYGRKAKRFSDASLRWETVIEPCCRRADNG